MSKERPPIARRTVHKERREESDSAIGFRLRGNRVNYAH